VTPEEAKTSTQSSVDSTLESKVITTTIGTKVVTLTPPVVQSTLSENLTIEVTSSEEDASSEKFEETTVNPTSTEDSGEQIGVGEDLETEFPQTSSEEVEEIEEEATERTTTEYPETMEPFHINLTSPQTGNDSINSLNNFHSCMSVLTVSNSKLLWENFPIWFFGHKNFVEKFPRNLLT
jgi:hypothetical protein